MYAITSGLFSDAFYLEKVEKITYIPLYILNLPWIITFHIIYLFLQVQDASEAAFGAAVWATFIAPITALIFWSFVFYVSAKLSNIFLKTENIVARHLISISIFLIIIISLLYQFFIATT